MFDRDLREVIGECKNIVMGPGTAIVKISLEENNKNEDG